MLYEAITYKDIDDFNGDAQNRHTNALAAGVGAKTHWQWKVIHLNVNKNGTLFVLWCRQTLDA